jgi:hypothetical protein
MSTAKLSAAKGEVRWRRAMTEFVAGREHRKVARAP